MGIQRSRPVHKWTTYYNPRNGVVRIMACEKCGVARGLEAGVHHCVAVEHEQHKMHLMGWEVSPNRI